MRDSKIVPKYPIYIPSKGRYDQCLTARFLIRDKIPFKLVIEEQEYDQYASEFGKDKLLVLPFSNMGSVIPARNWIKKHATEAGYKRHWQLDDNIREVYRWYKGKRIRVDSNYAFYAVEEFTDRYTNIAISGMQYYMFGVGKQPPFYLNMRVYSCSLVLNEIPHKWRGRYNEDTDLCLQVLADGWCTVLVNAFLVNKIWTMQMKGGNTDAIYHDDGRLRMARSLERLWPGVVTTDRRFQRPQHVVHDSWRKFDTPLIRRKDLDFSQFENKTNEYGMKLNQKADEIKSEKLRKIKDYFDSKND